MRAPFTALMMIAVAGTTHAWAEPTVSDPTGVSLAIYGDGRSVVREVRSVDDAADGGTALIPDLPDDLDLSSLSVEIDGVPAASLEIRRDSLAPSSLLRRSLGRTVTWLVPVGENGDERAFTGTLVNVDGGIVLEIDGRFEAMAPGRLVLDALPPGMTGGLEVQAALQPSSGDGALVTRYLTPNLSWSADYDAVLSPDADGLVLSGRYAIHNNTATDFEAATIRLVAGDTERLVQQDRMMMAETAVALRAAPASAPPPPSEATLGDVHVYDLAEPIRLSSNRMTRRVLLAPSPVPVEKLYRLEGSGVVPPNSLRRKIEGLRPSVTLEMTNETGQALPAGAIRVFGALADDGPNAPPVVLGEARLDHLPEGEKAKLRLGRAFDVTAERVVTGYEVTGAAENRWRQPYRASHAITIRNGRAEPVEVTVQEMLNGRDWRIRESSLEPSNRDAGSVTWTVAVPAGGETVLTYSVSVTP